MLFMNDSDIFYATSRYANHPVLGPAARFLDAFKDEVNQHSDGWAYWAPPLHAAKRLMEIIQGTRPATRAELVKAMAPIKSFMTRRGNVAGMKMPEDPCVRMPL
jgi:hypothetical protein